MWVVLLVPPMFELIADHTRSIGLELEKLTFDVIFWRVFFLPFVVSREWLHLGQQRTRPYCVGFRSRLAAGRGRGA